MNNSWLVYRVLTEWLAQGLVSSVSGVQVAVSPQALSASRATITLHRGGALAAIVDVHASLESATASPPADGSACLVTAASGRGLYRLVSGVLALQSAYPVSAAIGDAVATLVAGVTAAASKAETAVQPAALASAMAAEAAARTAGDDALAGDVVDVHKRLNKYFVTFYGAETRPIIDVANGVVRYGRMVVTRNGQSWKDVDPSDYSLSYFTAPISPVGGSSSHFHYIDVAVIGTSNPVKSVPGATVPTLTESIIPLGVSLDGVYQSYWSGDAESTDRPLEMRSVSMEAAIIIDRNNRLGGGTAVYVPRQIYANAPLSGVTISTFVANAASSELSTHVKFILPSSAPTNACSIYLDVETSQYSMATYPTLPAGSGRGFVPVATVWKDSHTSFNGIHCIDSIDYDIQSMRDRLWSCAITTKQAIIWDRSNFYGGGAEAIYIPMAIYIRQGSKEVKVTSGFGNSESSELLGYMKVTGVGSSTVHALIFTASTKTFEIRTYGSDLDIDPEKLSDVYVLATIWVGTWTGIDHVNTNYGVESNQTPFGKSYIDQMPHFFGTTTIQDVTEENLLALGFAKGAADITSANRPFFGDDFKEYIRGGWIHIKFWVQTDTANNFGSPDVYFWTGVGGSYLDLTSSNVKKVKSLSNYAAQYEYRGRLPSNVDYSFFYVGTSTQSTSIHTVITGVQYAISRNVFFNILDTDFPDPSADVTEQAFAARDAANIGLSRSYADRIVANVQRPTAGINVKFVTGQSLARGHQTQFALSGVALYGNKMLGGNALPTADDGATYPTFAPGDSWQDLVAIPEINGTVYTNATSPDGAFGEPWNLGWLNFGKHLFNQMRLVDNDARVFATFNTSVSGKTIEQLSKVNTQDSVDRFSRLTDAIDRAVSASSGSSAVIASVMFGQGEYDYSTTNGSVKRTRALYKSALDAYFTDIKAEIMARVPDQKLGPAFFSYVTGASYTVDTDANGDPDLFVAMAQLELSDERDDLWIVGPVYPYPDKSGHLTANGSRWFGNLLAKVEHRVQHLGQDWGPVRPKRIQLINSEIFIDFHVPEPPLIWNSGYVVQTAAMYTNKGFRVIDRGNSNANVSISSVELVGSTIVRITLTGSFSESLSVYYADKLVHNGNGNLCDSDRTIAHDVYVYDASFMPTTENHAELVGKPYPLNNWCVPFFLPIGYGL